MFTKKNYILFIILLVLIAGAYLYTVPYQNWRDKKNDDEKNFLAHIDMELVNKIEVITKKGDIYTINKESGLWWAEPNKWPTEKIIMDAMEEKMTSIINSELEIASVNPKNKNGFETGENGMRVKMWQDELAVADFIIGKVANDYSSTFISRDNDDNTYKAKETLARAFDVESWQDRTITNINETIDTVVLKYSYQEVEITNLPDSRGEVYWRSIRPYVARLSKEKTEELVNTTTKLEASAIPEQNTEGAGLDKPFLEIQLKGEVVDETLIVGNKDEKGKNYFLQKKGDSKLFLISDDSYDALAKQIVDLR